MINIQVDKSEKCNGNYSLYITFPYNQNIVEIMRSEPIRYWHPESKEWEIPAKNFPKLNLKLKDYELNISDPNEILSNLEQKREYYYLYTQRL